MLTRCFVGIELAPQITAALIAEQNNLKNQKLLNANWCKDVTLHVTLRFMGELNPDELSLLQTKLKTVQFQSFPMEIGPIAYFKGDQRCPIRSINASVGGAKDLQSLVDSALLPEFKPEKRHVMNMKKKDFKHHITLCRVKGLLGSSSDCHDAITNSSFSTVVQDVSSFVLFKSVLSKQGPTYSILERYSCTM